jgi:hypothetical protein
MSSALDPKLYFKSLRTAILKNKDASIMDKNSEVLTLSFTDLIYSVTPSREESIAFKVLNLDFTLDSNGEITLMEFEDGKLKFYQMGDGPMRNRILEFLAWRANVVMTSGI